MSKIAMIVADDFTPNPMRIRKMATSLSFGAVNHCGHVYEGVGMGDDPRLEPLIESLVGFPVAIKMGFFRLGMAGMKMNTFIHADNMGAQFAGVLYLNLPEQRLGGTSFWRHNRTGWHETPKDLDAATAKQLASDGLDEFKWTRESHVAMRLNRFLTYPANLFHSRYPNDCNGASVEEGRLVYATFYDRR